MRKLNNQMKSVRMRLFLTLSIAIAIILLVLVSTNSIVLKTFYTYSKYRSIKKAYIEINEMYKNKIVLNSEELDKIADKNNFEILVTINDNFVIYTTSEDFIDTINKNREIIYMNNKIRDGKKLLYAKDNIVINLISTNGLNCILLSGKLDNGYTIYIEVPIAAIEESVRISNNLLIIMGIIIAIISFVIASVISTKFTKPILQLNDIANKMANLDFSEKYIVDDSDDEINELGKSINKMSDKLETTIKQLRKNNNQLEKDIEEKSKIDEMRKQFISDVSHELKTPIALIQGYAEGLIENVNTDEESKKYYAEVILDESNKMDMLVRKLLELMKIEYGGLEFNNKQFNICELIKENIRKHSVKIQEKNITVKFDYNSEVYVYADEFYIDQVFTNYFTNAIKNTKSIDGITEIIINIKKDTKNNKARVSVFNTGEQISEENLEKIWVRFYKVDSSRNRNDGGTGIGLSLVRAIMTNYNWSYGVINRENGVEFYFDVQLKN